MSPIKLRILIDAKRFVEGERAERRPDERTIQNMIRLFNATCKLTPSNNTLRCCGVTGNCTWSRDKGLLDSWLKAAIRQIAKEVGL